MPQTAATEHLAGGKRNGLGSNDWFSLFNLLHGLSKRRRCLGYGRRVQCGQTPLLSRTL